MKHVLKVIAALALVASFAANAEVFYGQVASIGDRATPYTTGEGYDPDKMAITVPVKSGIKIGARVVICTSGIKDERCATAEVAGFIISPTKRVANLTPAVFDRLGIPQAAGVAEVTFAVIENAK
jgi:hypothetical protein